MGVSDEERSMPAAGATQRGNMANDADSAGGAARAGARLDAGAERDIRAAIDDDDHPQALVLCTRHYGALIGRLCMALSGSQADAEDLTQDTLIAGHAAFDSWRGEGSMRAFLLAIARRKCAKHIEKKVRRTARLKLVHDADRMGAARHDSSRDVEKQALRRERADKARDALGRLRPSEREALLLRYGADLSYHEVGQACGIDDAAARKRVSRAIAGLRDVLSEQRSEP
jgi:RNA polymerase sigma-70 factor (ECF subfamily)